MHISRIAGIGLLAVGFLLLYLAYQSTEISQNTPGHYIGRYSDRTVWLIVSGLGLTILGVLLTVLAPRLPK